MSKRSKSSSAKGNKSASKKREAAEAAEAAEEQPVSDNVAELQSEVRRLRARVAELSALDVLVVWNGEDGGPRVRVLAPTTLRAAAERALTSVWDYDAHADSIRPVAYLSGERRPCASLYRVRVQTTEQEVDLGEPDFIGQSQHNMPDI